jgi:hypothetical protein
MRKINLVAIATAAVSMAFAGVANATSILTYGSANPVNVVWNGSALNLNDNDSTVQSKLGFGTVTGQNVTFTGLTSPTYTAVAGGFDLNLSGGSFNIGSGLLTGTFTSADLTGQDTSNVGFVAFNGVVYTGGSWLPANFSDTIGTALSTEFNLPSSTTWANFDTGSSISAFNGSDATTASGTVVASPEPASVVTFAMGAIALMLMVGAVRRRAGAQL